MPSMRRADRLFQLVQLIRGRRLSTAAWLAERLEVSERTVYRDVADLQRQGVPIDGEAGVGYRMGKGFDLPPLMFQVVEAQALAASVRLAQPWMEPRMAAAAEAALGRVLSVVPPFTRAAVQTLGFYAPPMEAAGAGDAVRQRLAVVRQSMEARCRLAAHYTDAQGRVTQRTLRPLGCFYWGKVWTLAAWCEDRSDFRSFRLDRMNDLVVLQGPGSRYSEEPGRTLADFLRHVAPPEVAARWAPVG